LWTSWEQPEELAAFADCDGDGTVDAGDVNAIIQNWGAKQGQAVAPDSDRVTVCHELLRAIDENAQAPGMAAVRAVVTDYLRRLLGIPAEFHLDRNRPNPFRDSTKWVVSSPVPTSIQLEVFDPSGKLIWRILLPNLAAGTTPVIWGGEDLRGKRVPSGVYYYRLAAESYHAAGKAVLIR